jgi:nucleotide-binding universal stress UspA family protein
MEAKSRAVVVGVDFGACGDAAIVEGLTQLASGSAQKLHVMHVLDPRDVIDHPERRALETQEEILARAPGLLERRVRDIAGMLPVRYQHGQVVTHTRLGSAVETLLQTCVDYDADLLIVGTHGRRGLDRMLLGSVAEALVRKARCPVMVARTKDYTGLSKTELPDPPLADARAPQRAFIEDRQGITSTTLDSWHPSDNGPTGFRIV